MQRVMEAEEYSANYVLNESVRDVFERPFFVFFSVLLLLMALFLHYFARRVYLFMIPLFYV